MKECSLATNNPKPKHADRWCRVVGLLEHRRFPLWVMVIALLWALPTLWSGMAIDDYLHVAQLQPSGMRFFPSDWALFSFYPADDAMRQSMQSKALIPWWADSDLRVGFMRPIATLTHRVDALLWPGNAFAMHAHNLVWFIGMVCVAIVFFRRMLTPRWAASLATLFFVFDDHQLGVVGWIAGRNTLLAMFFGLATLYAFDRWRRDHHRRMGIVAHLCLVLCLMSSESGAAIFGFLLSYSLFVDPAGVRTGLRSLIGGLVIGLLWLLIYRMMGFGVAGCGVYVDPLVDPGRFLVAALTRAPLYLYGVWTDISVDFWTVGSPFISALIWWNAVVFVAGLMIFIVPLVVRNPQCRFWFLGMLLAVIPVCGSFPSERLGGFVLIGAVALLIQWRRQYSGHVAWSLSKRFGAGWSLLILLGQLVSIPLKTHIFFYFASDTGEATAIAAQSLEVTPDQEKRPVVVVNTPSFYFLNKVVLAHRHVRGQSPFPVIDVLSESTRAVRVERIEERTIEITPTDGWFPPTGTGRNGPQPVAHPRFFVERFAPFYCDRWRGFRVGDGFDGTTHRAHVVDLHADGRPMTVSFEFKQPLESMVWMQHKGGRYQPFDLPKVGQSVTIPQAKIPPWDAITDVTE